MVNFANSETSLLEGAFIGAVEQFWETFREKVEGAPLFYPESKEANRGVIQLGKKIVNEKDWSGLFFINIPSGLPVRIVEAKITAQALVSERFFFERLFSLVEKVDRILDLQQVFLKEGEGHVFFPFAHSKSFAMYVATPIVPEEAPPLVLPMHCKLHRILACAPENSSAAERALRTVTKELRLLKATNTECSPFWKTLESLDKLVQLFIEEIKEFSPRILNLMFIGGQRLFLKDQGKKAPYSQVLLSILDKISEKNLPSYIFPLGSLFLFQETDPTEFFKRFMMLIQKNQQMLKEALAQYFAGHNERAKVYQSAMTILYESRKRFFELVRKDKTPWSKHLIKAEAFTSPFSSAKMAFFIDESLQEESVEGSSEVTRPLPLSQKKPPKKEHKIAKQKHVQQKLVRVAAEKEGSAASSSSSAQLVSVELTIKDEKTVSFHIGDGPKLDWQYHPRVARWFDSKRDPTLYDFPYAGTEYKPEVRMRIKVQHAFGRAVHPVIVSQGKCFSNPSVNGGRGCSRYTMLGEILYSGCEPEKGVFTIGVGSDGIIYHAFFTKKKVEELVREYKENGFFASDEQERVISEEGVMRLEDDGSRIVSVVGETFVVEDKANKVFLWAHSVKDPIS